MLAKSFICYISTILILSILTVLDIQCAGCYGDHIHLFEDQQPGEADSACTADGALPGVCVHHFPQSLHQPGLPATCTPQV